MIAEEIQGNESYVLMKQRLAYLGRNCLPCQEQSMDGGAVLVQPWLQPQGSDCNCQGDPSLQPTRHGCSLNFKAALKSLLQALNTGDQSSESAGASLYSLWAMSLQCVSHHQKCRIWFRAMAKQECKYASNDAATMTAKKPVGYHATANMQRIVGIDREPADRSAARSTFGA